MLYRKLETSGEEISALGFGCMRLPQKLGRIDAKRAIRQIHTAIDKGINYFDTSMSYHGGASEPLLGEALSRGFRDRVKIATKLTPVYAKSRQDMPVILSAQFKNLKTDRVDFYLLHALEHRNWKRMERLGVLDFLDREKRQGRIKNVGFSFHGDKDVFPDIVDAYDWDFCQIQYSILDERNQAGKEGLAYAANKGLGVFVMTPLRGGGLAGKMPRNIESLWKGAPGSRSPVEWMLRWVWNHQEVTCVVCGMNEEEHIEENTRVAGEAIPNSLTSQELQLLARVREEYGKLNRTDCTGCRYCMPCPEGVNIPACLEFYNIYHAFGERFVDRFLAHLRLDGIGEAPEFPSLCTGCGKCSSKCPQHIDIPRYLKEAAKDFEGGTMRAIMWMTRKFLRGQGKSIRKNAEKGAAN